VAQAFNTVAEGRAGELDNTTIIACREGVFPPNGLCPGYWPHVPRALTHVSLDTYEGDCFWEGLSARGIYESYLYPKMSAEQKAFVVPGLNSGGACHPTNSSCTSTCTGMYSANTTSPWTHRPALGANVEDLLVVKVKQYLLWTQQDPRIVG